MIQFRDANVDILKHFTRSSAYVFRKWLWASIQKSALTTQTILANEIENLKE